MISRCHRVLQANVTFLASTQQGRFFLDGDFPLDAIALKKGAEGFHDD